MCPPACCLISWASLYSDTLCRDAGSGLVELFIPRANRETVQKALNRGNALMVTVVEVDFAFAAESSVSGTCRAILLAAALWRSIGRSSVITSRTPIACSVPDKQIHPGPPQACACQNCIGPY